MLATIEHKEGARDKKLAKFRLIPVLKEGRRYITLDKVGLQMPAAHDKSRRDTNDENAAIGEKFRDLEAFEGLPRGQRWKRGFFACQVIRTSRLIRNYENRTALD